MAIIQIKNIYFDLCSNDFLVPYLRRALHADEGNEEFEPDVCVRIYTDESACDKDKRFDSISAERGLPVAELRCPYIVGTGMKGLMHRIAAGIYKGSFVHIKGNESHISVVHAIDVAAAAILAAGTSGLYTLTDGYDPTIRDLADALAYRMDDKRIITIKPTWSRLWYGRAYYEILTTDHVAKSTFEAVFPEFRPVIVTEYLHTHVYDESSL